MSRISFVLEQIKTARAYTESFTDGLKPDDWFRRPSEGVTHIAWQFGHLAAAEYFLTLNRIRGPKAEDGELISDKFLKQFGKGSVPDADPRGYPSAEEILATARRVHNRALDELEGLSETVLDEPVDNPHPMFSTKYGALAFCSLHEMLHAGQIGLVRRLLGNAPLR